MSLYKVCKSTLAMIFIYTSLKTHRFCDIIIKSNRAKPRRMTAFFENSTFPPTAQIFPLTFSQLLRVSKWNQEGGGNGEWQSLNQKMPTWRPAGFRRADSAVLRLCFRLSSQKHRRWDAFGRFNAGDLFEDDPEHRKIRYRRQRFFRNMAHHHLRRNRIQLEDIDSLPLEDEKSVADEVEKKFQYEQIMKALETLPSEQALAIKLKYVTWPSRK